jgi:hypothetical protein
VRDATRFIDMCLYMPCNVYYFALSGILLNVCDCANILFFIVFFWVDNFTCAVLIQNRGVCPGGAAIDLNLIFD